MIGFVAHFFNHMAKRGLNAWMNEWMVECMDEWMNGWTDEWMNGWTNEWRNERMGHLSLVTHRVQNTPCKLFSDRNYPQCYYEPVGKDYRGTKSVTLTGKSCQQWASQSPHRHEYTPDRWHTSWTQISCTKATFKNWYWREIKLGCLAIRFGNLVCVV